MDDESFQELNFQRRSVDALRCLGEGSSWWMGSPRGKGNDMCINIYIYNQNLMHGVDLKKIYIELYNCIYIYTQYSYMYQLFCILFWYTDNYRINMDQHVSDKTQRREMRWFFFWPPSTVNTKGLGDREPVWSVWKHMYCLKSCMDSLWFASFVS